MAYDLGIVIPVYKSRESVKQLVCQLEQIFLPDIKIRICLVDDSNDRETARYLRENCLSPEVTLVVLDGNYGQQAAVLCGLEHIGPCRVYGTIDDDLEQPPRILKELYGRVMDGYDLAYGIADHGGKRRPAYRRIGSRMRDILFSYIIGAPCGIKVSSLRAMKAWVAEDVLGTGDGGDEGGCKNRCDANGFFYLSAAVLKGAEKKGRKLRVGNLPYQPSARHDGKSGYSIASLLRLYGNIIWYYGLNLGRWGKEREVYGIKEMIQRPKLLILGGSNCQLHGAQRARAMGVDTVLADYTQNPPGAAICGVHEKISTFDVKACIRAARQYKVTGVMTMGTDQPVHTAAVICEELGLPSLLSAGQALSVTNKKQMKQILLRAGIPTAVYRIVDRNTRAVELLDMKAPLVIKPLDSQGQRGIYRVWGPGELLGHLEDTLSFSRCEEALAEEFYDSDEVTVSGWIKDSVLYILTVTDRLLYPDQTHIGVCTGHRFPSVHMDMYGVIKDISFRVAEAFGLKDGPFYLQLLIGKEGIKVNELASRIGGAFEDVFIPWISGFDILGAVIDSALGNTVDTGPLKGYRADAPEKCAAVQLLFCSPGKIGFMTPLEELLSLPYIMDAGYNYKEGQEIPVMTNATARFGHAVICGTKDRIDGYVDDFYRRISVRSVQGEEMVTRFYP